MPVLESHVFDITRVIQLAVAPVCLLIGTAFVGAFISLDLSRPVAILFVAAVAALTVCLMLFMREVFLAALSVHLP